MATEIVDPKIQSLFDNLESQKTLLSNYTTIYKTLTTHYTTLINSITAKSQTLDTKMQSLDSDIQSSIDSINHRENCIPDRLASLSAAVESSKDAALAEFEKPPVPFDAPLAESMRSMCRRMDHNGLLKLALARRWESASMRAELVEALAECVDAARLVVDLVREFVAAKGESKGERRGKGGVADKRWVLAMVVGGLFDGKGDGGGARFARVVVERAVEAVKEWREVANGGGMGPAEASILLQVVIGFGLKERLEEEFYRKIVVEFAARRDMPKFAMALFGDKVGDVIDELIKNGKQVEAVYFAVECGLTKRFQPASLLKSFLENTESAATDEANTSLMSSIRSIIKCVEDLKIESEFPVENLKKQLGELEKAKADKKKVSSTDAPKSSNKRGYGSGAPRSGGPAPHRPPKMSKFSSPYSSYNRRNPVPPVQQNPVSRYSPLSSYPSYDAGLTTSYGPSYGGSHITPSPQITQHHYGVHGPGDSAGVGGQFGGSYGVQIGYGSYDYGTAAPSTYKPSPYP